MQVSSIPFKVLALAPFKPQEENPWLHEPIQVDKANIDEMMKGLGLSLDISLPQNLCLSDSLSIHKKVKRLSS